MIKLNLDKVELIRLTDGYRLVSERAQKIEILARNALKQGKKFNDVRNIKLKLDTPYYIRRVWFKENSQNIESVDNKIVLSMWTGIWEDIEGMLQSSTASKAGLQVWS